MVYETLIEAPCPFRGDWLPQAQDGTQYQVSCPSGCDTQGPDIWGTGSYTSGSGICRAAIHAGVISSRGGVVTVERLPGRPAYRGSPRNGIKSLDAGLNRASFSIVGSP